MSPTPRALAALACLLAAPALAACGEASPGTAAHPPAAGTKTPALLAAATVGASARGAGRGGAREVADPQEANSFPAPATVKHAAAATPTKAAAIAAGAPSDEEVRHELQQMQAVERSAKLQQQRVLTPVAGGSSIGGNGAIPIPTAVPEVVQKVVAGANEIADFPY